MQDTSSRGRRSAPVRPRALPISAGRRGWCGAACCCGSSPSSCCRRRDAARRYGIAEAELLDLSAGINPCAYPVAPIPDAVWRCLPDDDDGLDAAAASIYGTAHGLPVPGTQAAIQTLPALFAPLRVAILEPTYGEHAWQCQRAGRAVTGFAAKELALVAATADLIVLASPNNPDAHCFADADFLAAAAALAGRGGHLLVDEAFADAGGGGLAALAGNAGAANLIVLRSLGKFFGLAGARVGFDFAAPELRCRLREAIGPWAVSGPARADARRLHKALARRGILLRCFDRPAGLRCGLPGPEHEWRRLAAAIEEIA